MVETGSRDHSAHLWLVRRPVPPPAGAMTLKQLNDRLEAYINGIGLNPEGPNVSIAVDRISEGGSFNIHDMPQWAEYQQMVSATSNTNIFCEAQARVRQGSARDGPQGERPQSLNPCLELTLKLVATTTHHHHPPPISLIYLN